MITFKMEWNYHGLLYAKYFHCTVFQEVFSNFFTYFQKYNLYCIKFILQIFKQFHFFLLKLKLLVQSCMQKFKYVTYLQNYINDGNFLLGVASSLLFIFLRLPEIPVVLLQYKIITTCAHKKTQYIVRFSTEICAQVSIKIRPSDNTSLCPHFFVQKKTNVLKYVAGVFNLKLN